MKLELTKTEEQIILDRRKKANGYKHIYEKLLKDVAALFDDAKLVKRKNGYEVWAMKGTIRFYANDYIKPTRYTCVARGEYGDGKTPRIAYEMLIKRIESLRHYYEIYLKAQEKLLDQLRLKP